jgi:hypothetical protein
VSGKRQLKQDGIEQRITATWGSRKAEKMMQNVMESIGQFVPNMTRFLPIPFIHATNAGGNRCRA